jgi:dipeptidase D
VRNAIPREAEAAFACPAGSAGACRQRLSAFGETVRQEYALTDGGLWFRVEAADKVEKVVGEPDTRKIIQFLRAVPTGVSEMSAEMEGFVETSNSVGIIELLEDGFHAVSSQRSAVGSRLEEITARVEALAGLAGAQTRRNVMTQPWQPDYESPLLKRCVAVYERCFGEQPKLELTHGGLECGVLSSRIGPLDAISLGPTIINAHSPDESLFVPSVDRTWQFLTALLASFGGGEGG